MNDQILFKVRFFENDRENPIEALVRIVEPSEFPGLVCFADFVFKDQTKKIIMPDEDKALKRFKKTRSLHIPYHNILYIEEIEEEAVDLKQLPFLREIATEVETTEQPPIQ